MSPTRNCALQRATAIATATLACLAGGGGMAQDLTPVSVQTDWIPSGEHAMYYGGWSKGIFEQHGIDITITRGYGSGDTVTKMARIRHQDWRA